MPMIDAYAAAGTFDDTHQLAVDLATAVMTIEQDSLPRDPARLGQSCRCAMMGCVIAVGGKPP